MNRADNHLFPTYTVHSKHTNYYKVNINYEKKTITQNIYLKERLYWVLQKQKRSQHKDLTTQLVIPSTIGTQPKISTT